MKKVLFIASLLVSSLATAKPVAHTKHQAKPTMSFKQASRIAYDVYGDSVRQDVTEVIFEVWKNQIQDRNAALAQCQQISDSEGYRLCYIDLTKYYDSINYDMWTPQGQRERDWENGI